MRHTIRVVTVLALVWIGYLAWPIYDLFVLIRAVPRRGCGYEWCVFRCGTRLAQQSSCRRLPASRPDSDRSVATKHGRRCDRQSGRGKADLTRSGVAAAQRWLAHTCTACTARHGWNNDRHDRNRLAGFCEFRVWLRPVRSRGAGGLAAAATISSPVPTFAVALAAGRDHRSRAYRELARRRARQGRAKMIAAPAP